MKSADIRNAFLSFFEEKGHARVPSASLIPGNDPTLLFTNAGMVQFKDVFLGQDKRPYSRAVSSQRCVRAGGKHNDLENVGYTARHHTFFEMLGNFSFGDYFKREAIQFAWEFLTETLSIPKERLWVTVHITDDEAADIWVNEIGVPKDRLSRLDEDNFWQMGDTGPCGPSSEIFYDHGEDIPGGPPGSENDDLDRYIEIWNLVFMQYERQADGTLVPLPKPSVDTGMGLERMAAVLQHVHSNYEIDLFQALLKAAAEATGTKDLENKSLRVIADHIRSCAFLILDGVLPSNEGRGYVLRRIMRRAIRHGHKLGQSQAFMHKLVPALVEQMGDAYPALGEKSGQIAKVILAEEEQFAKTLDKGMGVLEAALEKLKGKVIPGETVFTLYDTYGFPVDLTNDIAREKGLTIDQEVYDTHMEAQRKRARAAGAFKMDYTDVIQLDGRTEFSGYRQLQQTAKVTALLKGQDSVDELKAGDEGVVVLDETPFYGESGGQVGDTGTIRCGSSVFEVHDCQKNGANHIHIGVMLEGSLKSGDAIEAEVDEALRQAVALNHSATHLIHAALRQVLGEHVAQKGSLVDSEKLRFDFSHFEPVSDEQLQQVSDLVNSQIRANTEVATEVCDMESAKEKGAMMLFGEKYGDVVRVLSMGDGFSVELCGGTHVTRTGDIGVFKIVSETGIASGVRRIEAITGEKALRSFEASEHTLNQIAAGLKTNADKTLEKFEQLQQSTKSLEKALQQAQAKLAAAQADEWLAEAVDVNGIKVLAKVVEGADGKVLKELIDKLRDKLGSSAVFLAGPSGEKVALAAGVSKDATKKLKAGDLLKHVAGALGGKGGGRPDMAQGGAPNSPNLVDVIDGVIPWVRENIQP